MATPFPFISTSILTADALNQIGENQTDWTPSFAAGVTVGNGTVSGNYQQVNELIVVQGSFVLGSTSAITGDVRVDLPVNAVNTFELSNSTFVQILDTSASRYFRGSGRAQNATEVRLRVLIAETASSDYVYAKALSSTIPMTWASGDRLEWLSIYRTA